MGVLAKFISIRFKLDIFIMKNQYQSARFQGVARALMQFAEEYARKEPFSQANLCKSPNF